jgi:hypothetical protein
MYTCMYVYMYIYVCVYVCTCICTHVTLKCASGTTAPNLATPSVSKSILHITVREGGVW